MFGQAIAPGPVRVGLCPPPISDGRSPSSLLPQEVQERLVEGYRILVAHKVCGLGDDHQATAGNALHGGNAAGGGLDSDSSQVTWS